MVVPVPAKSLPPKPFKRAYGTTVLEMLGFVLEAKHTIKDGTVMMQNSLDRPESARDAADSWIGEWITSASEADLRAAISKSGLSLSTMSSADRLSMLAKLGLYQEVLEGFVENGDEARLAVRFAIAVRGTDRAGKPIRFDIEGSRRLDRRNDATKVSRFERVPADPLTRKGDLDFGDGKVLTALEIRDAVYQKFGRFVEIDSRLVDTHLFVAGRYSFDQIFASLEFALAVPSIQEIDSILEKSPADVSRILGERFDSLLSEFENDTGIDPRWAMERRTMSAVVLAERSPAFRRFLEANGHHASTLQVTLSPTFLFQVSAPGHSPQPGRTLGSPPTNFYHNFSFAYVPK